MKLTYRIDNELTLRLLEPRHAEELFAVIDTNRHVILPWMRWVNEVADADVLRGMISQWVKQTAETGCMSLGVELDGELVGVVFHIRPDTINKQVEVGYWLAESARGKGVATRAVRAFIDVTIRDLGFNRVNIRVAPSNKPSLALAERLGLKPEGVSRQAWKVGDEYLDATEFGVLADEWEVKSPPFALSHRVDKDLELRLPELRHAEALYGVIDTNRDHVARWMLWLTDAYAPADAESFIRQNLTCLAEGNGCTVLMIYQDQFVGGIGNQPINPIDRSADIGYWLAESAQGNGIVTRAAHEMVDYSVRDLGLNRVTIHAAAENTKSQAVPERLGFDRVGVFRKAAALHGEFVDQVQYAMLAEDWKGGR
jgi:ribosomal-protein-serine acetyltransferase